MFNTDGNAKLSWSKFITDGTNSSKRMKIVTTQPVATKPPNHHKDRLGHELPVQNSYFSFEHKGALVLKGDPKVSMENMPNSPVAASSRVHTWTATGILIPTLLTIQIGMQ